MFFTDVVETKHLEQGTWGTLAKNIFHNPPILLSYSESDDSKLKLQLSLA